MEPFQEPSSFDRSIRAAVQNERNRVDCRLVPSLSPFRNKMGQGARTVAGPCNKTLTDVPSPGTTGIREIVLRQKRCSDGFLKQFRSLVTEEFKNASNNIQ